jgi:hypothetical protein
MLMPSTPVVLAAFAALAILLSLNWFIGGMAYDRKPARLCAEDSPGSGETGTIKKAA